jgi:hypothetical protein
MAAYPGLDVDRWDDRLIWLWQRSNLRFCGFYLAHDRGANGSSWTTHWHDLRDVGWGAFPLWVPFPSTAIDLMKTADGQAHGRHAAALAEAAGLEKGAVLYLDIENQVFGNDKHSPFLPYVIAWMTAVTAARYRPGAYCSFLDVTREGLLSPALDRLRPVLFPFCVAPDTRARFDRDTFTLPPAPFRSWPFDRRNSGWQDSPAVIGCQYDWYRAGRTDQTFDWPDKDGRRNRRDARDVDWDAAKVFDPAHPRAAGTVAAAPDKDAPDWMSLYVVRPTLIEKSARGRDGRPAPSIELALTPADIGPAPAPELDGFDANGAAAVSRRTDHHDLFVLGLDGLVRTAWVSPREERPRHPWPLNPGQPARKGSPLAAVSRVPDQVDVFYVDRSHLLVTQWWHPSRPEWARQRRVIGGPPVAGASALGVLPAPTDAAAAPDRLDVFYVTFDHSLPGSAGSAWPDRWQPAHAFWTSRADWQTEIITVPGGIAARQRRRGRPDRGPDDPPRRPAPGPPRADPRIAGRGRRLAGRSGPEPVRAGLVVDEPAAGGERRHPRARRDDERGAAWLGDLDRGALVAGRHRRGGLLDRTAADLCPPRPHPRHHRPGRGRRTHHALARADGGRRRGPPTVTSQSPEVSAVVAYTSHCPL